MSQVIPPPVFRTYLSKTFLAIIERVYKLQRLDVFSGDRPDTPFFRSRNVLRTREGFLLPFQYYATPVVLGGADVQPFFSGMEAWSQRTDVNLAFSTLNDYEIGRHVIAARNPLLRVPADEGGLEAGFSRNLRSSLRRNKNKAHRARISIRNSHDLSDLEDFYRCVLAPQYVKKHRMVFQPLTLYQALLSTGMAHLVIARQEKSPIGGLILVEGDGGLHYGWGASLSPDQIAVGTLMLRHALADAVRRQLDWFDFGSTPLSDNNLHRYKLRWGCDSHPVRRYYTLRAPRLVDLNVSFAFPRRLFSLLPPSLACALMPRIVPWLVS